MHRLWMPIYWSDYFGDTRHLTRAQHACYLLLIGHYWMHGSLPTDDQQLALITQSTMEEWLTDKPVVQAFFHDGWKHKRIEAELHRSARKLTQAREAGQKGGLTASLNREKARYAYQRLK